MIRYAVIGTGMMGIEHIMNLREVDGAQITAISDPNEQSRAHGLQAVGTDVPAFETHQELLDSGLVDAVVVASPNMTHAGVLADLLAHDELHILVEKPLCTTVADCRMVIEAAADRPGLVWVGLEYRYMAPIARLVDEVKNGTIGDLKMLAIREHRFPFLEKVDNWNRFSANSGGTLVEKCCHYFDLMNLIADAEPVRVFASGGQDVNHLDEVYDGRRSDILDNAYVIVEYENGVRSMLDLCMFAEATHNQEELSAVGDRGKVEALIPEDVIRIGRRGEHYIGNVEAHPTSNAHVAYQGHHHGSSYLEHVDFLAAIHTGSAPKITLEDGLKSVAVGVAAHRSIDLGRPVEMSEVL